MSSSNDNAINSQSNTESISNQFSVEQRSREFIWKTFIIVSLQIAIVWEICSFVLLTETLRHWMSNTPWFIWTCGILGTLLQLEMLLIPQLQFAFPYNYMYLIVTILIMLCGFAMIWTVISEIGIIVQALLGDRRFTFRNDQHVLGGLIIGMLIIWLNLLVSTEVAISHVLFSPKQQTPALSASG
uniref:Uncharacterized protein n=1 Tax=Trichobilharzia regenti TaxID=157069 RepID=A0AA85J581_TRIRE|nr:unnamed protein product [Trichobilharzia regenti]